MADCRILGCFHRCVAPKRVFIKKSEPRPLRWGCLIEPVLLLDCCARTLGHSVAFRRRTLRFDAAHDGLGFTFRNAPMHDVLALLVAITHSKGGMR